MQYTITDRHWRYKPSDKQVSYVHFKEVEGTISDLVDSLKNGYGFCHLFKQKSFHIGKKTLENFVASQIIALDVDGDYSMPLADFVRSLTVKPTIAHTTYNNEDKGERYRLLYVLDEPLYGENMYRMAYHAICHVNNLTLSDDCGERPSQFMFGTKPGAEFIVDESMVYYHNSLKNWLPLDVAQGYISGDIKPVKKAKKTEKSNNATPKSNKPKADRIHQPFDDMEFSRVWHSQDYHDILNNLVAYATLDRTYVHHEEGSYATWLNGADYYEVKRRWRMVDGKAEVKKYHNGERRRRHIFIACVIRHLINPDITIEQLAYAAVWEYVHQCHADNEPLTKATLYGIAWDALYVDEEKMAKYDVHFKVVKKYKVNVKKCKEDGINYRSVIGKMNGVLHHMRKNERWSAIAEQYDCTLSIRQNAERMGVSDSTIKRMMRSAKNGSETTIYNRENEEVGGSNNTVVDPSGTNGQLSKYEAYRELYIPTATDQENIETMGVPRRTYYRIKKYINSTTESTVPVEVALPKEGWHYQGEEVTVVPQDKTQQDDTLYNKENELPMDYKKAAADATTAMLQEPTVDSLHEALYRMDVYIAYLNENGQEEDIPSVENARNVAIGYMKRRYPSIMKEYEELQSRHCNLVEITRNPCRNVEKCVQ